MATPSRSRRGLYLTSLGAIAAGGLGGLAAVGFRVATNLVANVAFYGQWSIHSAAPLDSPLGWEIALLPVLGAALILLGMVAFPWGGKATGGTSEVIEAASLRGGRIPTLQTLRNVALAAVSLGTGGSAGREGPIVHLGALGGSWVGSLHAFSRRERRVLIACGATAALAATFNAPVAGVVFALEVILLEFRTLSFVPLVVSSVVGTSVGRLLLGNSATFVIPHGLFELATPWELPLYALLGLAAGALSLGLLALFRQAEKLRGPAWLPWLVGPILAGVGLGAVGLVQPRLLGVGYETVNAVLNDQLGQGAPLLALLALLLVLKPLAVALTLRSGGSGGVFSPTLFEGTVFGALFGAGIATLAPGLGVQPGAFALVGMAAVFAGVTRASLTAIVLVIELTLSFDIVLPVMLACVAADLVAWSRHPGSLYTAKLQAKGSPVALDLEPNVLDLVLVSQVMRSDVATLPAAGTLQQYLDHSMNTGQLAFPLVDAQGQLSGVVTRTDVRTKGRDLPMDAPLSALASSDLVVAYPDETVHMAIDKLVGRGIGHLPVVDRAEPRKLLGWLTRVEVLSVEGLRLEAEERAGTPRVADALGRAPWSGPWPIWPRMLGKRRPPGEDG